MKSLLVIFGLLAWIGSCQEDKNVLDAEVNETDAIWSNMLATDGCSWHFEVVEKDTSYSLAPADESLQKIEKAVGAMEGAYSSTKVHLKYSRTGKKKDVQCGWGHKANYDEIEVHEIYKTE